MLTERRAMYPWNDHEGLAWPLIEQLFLEKKISYIDSALAYQILEEGNFFEEESALFICYLSKASRKGHLCVDLSNNLLNPSLNDVWEIDQNTPNFALLNEKIMKGARDLPASIKATVKNLINGYLPLQPICEDKNLFYLQKQWVFEKSCLNAFLNHLKEKPFPCLERSAFDALLNEKITLKLLNQEQAQAISSTLDSTITLIAGGPGTGKTYTAGNLIKFFWEILPPIDRQKFKIVLTAPTGKAAANLQSSLNRATKNLEDFPFLQAKTLHSLLGIKGKTHSLETLQLEADLLIVDESSMIDLKMMKRLFECLKPNSRLILIGDPSQLASVEAGSIFFDLLEAVKDKKNSRLSATYLKTCLRTENAFLTDFAEKIKEGKKEEVLDTLRKNNDPALNWDSLQTNPKQIYKKLWSKVENDFPCFTKEAVNPDYFFGVFQKFRLLSALKEGPFGSDAINEAIYNCNIQKNPNNGWFILPLIITANDHKQHLFNGETGILVRKLPLNLFSEEDYALFPDYSQESISLKKIHFSLLPPHDYAYCLSIHKSQGSEFDHILLLLPDGSEKFGREILYTGVTRAKKKVEIWANEEVIEQVVEKKNSRLSGFQNLNFDRIKE